MTRTLLQGFEAWFDLYVKGFMLETLQDKQNIELKIDHTYRVKEATFQIGSQLSLSENEMLLAETMALFHDLGRFLQYKRYKTYKDSISENHAVLSVSELKKHKVLEVLSCSERELIYTTILHHNIAKLPDELHEKERFFCGLLRDADKVDILNVVTHYYEEKHEVENKAIQLELDDCNDISDNIVSCFLRREIIMVGDMKYVNDFKLMQLAWINDLNFFPALQLILKAKYFQRIVNTLPVGTKREKVSACLQQIVDEKLSEAHFENKAAFH